MTTFHHLVLQTLNRLCAPRGAGVILSAALASAAGAQVITQSNPYGSFQSPSTLVLTGAPGPISQLPFAIHQPGVYYLENDLLGVAGKVGILVTASGVTIDLTGHELKGVPGSYQAIRGDQAHDVTVRNGRISDWSGGGVWLGDHADIDSIHSSRNGATQQEGIRVGRSSRLRAVTSSADGIAFRVGANSSVMDCIAELSRYRGFEAMSGATFERCVADGGLGKGFQVSASSLIACSSRQCTAGFYAQDSSLLRECSATLNQTYGFSVGTGVTLEGCVASDNGGVGFQTGEGCVLDRCIGKNTSGGHGFAIGNGSMLSGCSATGNSQDGFHLEDEVAARNCVARSNGGVGMRTRNNCRVHDVMLARNGQPGFYLGNNSTKSSEWNDATASKLDDIHNVLFPDSNPLNPYNPTAEEQGAIWQIKKIYYKIENANWPF